MVTVSVSTLVIIGGSIIATLVLLGTIIFKAGDRQGAVFAKMDEMSHKLSDNNAVMRDSAKDSIERFHAVDKALADQARNHEERISVLGTAFEARFERIEETMNARLYNLEQAIMRGGVPVRGARLQAEEVLQP